MRWVELETTNTPRFRQVVTYISVRRQFLSDPTLVIHKSLSNTNLISILTGIRAEVKWYIGITLTFFQSHDYRNVASHSSPYFCFYIYLLLMLLMVISQLYRILYSYCNVCGRCCGCASVCVCVCYLAHVCVR